MPTVLRRRLRLWWPLLGVVLRYNFAGSASFHTCVCAPESWLPDILALALALAAPLQPEPQNPRPHTERRSSLKLSLYPSLRGRNRSLAELVERALFHTCSLAKFSLSHYLK